MAGTSSSSGGGASRIVFEDLKDAKFEEDLLRDPLNVANWWYYLEHKAHASSASRYQIFERAVKQLPLSYKLWYSYLRERRENARKLPIVDVEYTHINNAFERCLVHMGKMPVLWKEYLEFLMLQGKISYTRHAFDRALRALPITQHLQWIWPLYLQFARECGVPETASRVYRRYLKISPEDVEDYVEYLIGAGKIEEAAVQLSRIVGDENFVSQKGRSKHDYWNRLLEIITRNPTKVGQIDVEAVIRAGIRRYPQEVGALWVSLADFYVRLGQFDRARDTFEEGIAAVRTVRDFDIIFTSYSEFEESVLAALMESLESHNPELDRLQFDDEFDSPEIGVELRMKRFEQLVERRPLLVNSVLLRQNPHDVRQWQNRVKIVTNRGLADSRQQQQQGKQEGKRAPAPAPETDPVRMAQERRNLELILRTYGEAVSTVDPQQAAGKPHLLWVQYARFYERHGDLENARLVLQKATEINFRTVDELATIWCEWAEMELRAEQPQRALAIMKRAAVRPSRRAMTQGKMAAAELPVQDRLYRSAKLWSLYADLEENLGSLESTKQVYETMFDVKVITAELVVNYGRLLEENRFFEEAFRVYEKGIAIFKYPHVYPIWGVYLQKFLERYQGTKVERARDLFENAVREAPAAEAKRLFLLYAQFEEKWGQSRRAMDVYRRACERAPPSDRYELYLVYINRCAKLFGVGQCRQIYEKALETLPDQFLKPMCLKYAALERGLGEVDRARAIYIYGSQFCDPKVHQDYYAEWRKFELEFGNQETYKEMTRIFRTVATKFSQVNLMLPPTEAPAEAAAAAAGQEQQPSAMERLEDETRRRREEKEQQRAAIIAAASNPAEISLDMDMDDSDSDSEDSSSDSESEAPAGATAATARANGEEGEEEEVDIEMKAVPAAVFAGGSAIDRLKQKRGLQQ